MRFPGDASLEFLRRVRYLATLRLPDVKARFTPIYQHNLWGSHESVSGTGSDLSFTDPLRAWLISALPRYGVRILCDAPCGDFHWMQHVLQQSKVAYYGYDIVEELVAQNNALYSSEHIHFTEADIRSADLKACDLLIVRDVLFHLSYQDIGMFLENISKLDYKYLLTTTNIVSPVFENSDIITGDFRLIDLFSAPFHFPRNAVLEYVMDGPAEDPLQKCMVLLAKEAVPVSLS